MDNPKPDATTNAEPLTRNPSPRQLRDAGAPTEEPRPKPVSRAGDTHEGGSEVGPAEAGPHRDENK